MNQNSPEMNQDRISRKIKIPVILLTLATLIAFAVFFVKLSSSLLGSKKDSPEAWGPQMQMVGDKLKSAGLKEQAITQYINFLELREIDLKIRARVAQTVGQLYIELDNCPEAMPWLFQAETIGPAPSQNDILTRRIDFCLQKIKQPLP